MYRPSLKSRCSVDSAGSIVASKIVQPTSESGVDMVNKRIYFRKDGSTVECFSAISKKTGNIGVFSSEKEAAEARDRIILFLNLENSFTKLNFPERKEEFLKENLKEFYEKNLARPKKRALRL